MKKNRYRYTTILLMAVGLCACESELDITGIKHVPLLVVNSLVNSDELFSVQVSTTIPLKDTLYPKFIETAKVSVFDGVTLLAVLPYDLGAEKYVGSFKPFPGKTYTVMVEKTSFYTASGSMKLPEKLNSPSAKWMDNTGIDSLGFATGTITCFVADPQKDRNYYEINLYRYDDFDQSWYTVIPLPTDPLVNENAIRTEKGGMLIDDRNFNGLTKEFGFVTPFGSAGTQYKFLVEVRSLSDDYYRYLESLANYRSTSGLFSDPSPVFSNIANGRGICAGSSIEKDTIQ